MLANATKVEERGLAAGKVEAHAAADTRRTAERESARKAGVNREAEVNATHAVAGTVVGAVATNQALDAVKEGVNKANDLGNKIGDKAKQVFKD